MKKLTIYPITVLVAFFLLSSNLTYGQFNVKLTVNSGTATTTCTDPIGSPDPTWSINVEGLGWTDYPGNAFCPAPLPALLYDRNFQCLVDIPPTIQVCLRAFENDASILNLCTPVLTCQVEECFDIPIPLTGSVDYDLNLTDGLASDGQANITIAVEGFPGGLFDAVCDALDLGVLENGEDLGDANVSTYNNYCATGLNEPSPIDYGAVWSNEQSIWIKFTTSDAPSTIIKIETRSDPSNLGDPINLQMGVFTTDDNTCTGNFDLVAQNFTYTTKDELIYFECPEPNKTYFIIIDAVSGSFQDIEGYFSFEINELGLEDGPDLVCDAIGLGAVPEGDTISIGPMTNVCATGAGDAPNSTFFIDHGVWFSFEAPSTGHVLIEGISDTEDVPINMQLALYSSSDNTCSGILSPYESGYDNSSFDEALEVSCLNPGQTYFLLVDGQSPSSSGIFTLNISDAGDDTPVTLLDEVVCFGETFTVGNSTYSQSGSYEDTLFLPNGCDSVVLLDLEILTPLALNFSIVTQGVGPGNTDGQAQVSPTGSSGNYTFAWDNGQTTALASNLVGGDTYCVVVTDDIGCSLDTCFEMPYYIHFVPNVQGSLLDCFGDTDGTLEFTAEYGVPPYLYSWKNAQNTISGSGTITQDGQIITINNLPAGQYEVYLQDIVYDTTVLVIVDQPDLLEINSSITDASCFGECDGEMELIITGGTQPYQMAWSNGSATQQLTGLCQGEYAVTVTDVNGCTATYSNTVNQPAEFIATAIEAQPVSCFGGNDGSASVTTNGTPSAYLWSNNENTQIISDLMGGEYFVTVTNSDGCTDVSSILVNTPSAPVAVSISLLEPVTCNGGSNGALIANVTGPGNTFTYTWSNGSSGASATGLAANDYFVSVENEFGCQATATFFLTEPTPIDLSFSTNQLTCNDPVDGGIVTIEQISGGVPPYTYSADGFNFSDNVNIAGFVAGTQNFFVQDAGGCIIQVPATIEGPTELVVSLGNDLEIDLGDEVTLHAQVNVDDVTYEWYPSNDSLCNDCSSIDLVPTESGIYSVIVTDQFDCTEVADVFINVLKKRNVYVPNAFSPNDDGINDFFMPYTGKDVLRIHEFRVFDRQGNNVFYAADFLPGDFANGWNGIFRGQIMQPGVFAWFASVEFIDGVREVFKGDVTLVR